ncbi:hypothetical protein Bca101_013481 [Brassica carinata]
MMAKNHGVESWGEGGGKIVSDSSPFDSFPEDCISKIVSFTSPRDACVATTVSKAFESAAKSDVVWETFLPPEYAFLVPRSRDYASKKKLYFALCDEPVRIDDEKASGKRCIMLSAMNISIVWGDTPQYWKWITIPEARFKRVAELLNVCWFEIRGRVNTRVLSLRTRYSAYLVYKKADHCYGFDDVAIEARVGVYRTLWVVDWLLFSGAVPFPFGGRRLSVFEGARVVYRFSGALVDVVKFPVVIRWSDVLVMKRMLARLRCDAGGVSI